MAERKILHVSIGERVFGILNYIIMTFFMLLCIYPFYYVLIYSISNATEAAKGVYLYPAGIDFTTYAKIFEQGDLGSAFLVSMARTVLSTLLCVVFSSMLAYLVTQKDMLFRRFVYRFTIVSMYMGAGIIPWYITMKAYGLKDSFLLYIVPGAVSVFFVILVKTYIEQLPASLEESAAIDGAGFFTIFFRIIFPLCKPITATIAVYAAVGSWNEWMDNYLLVRNPHLQTVQLILYNYLNQAEALAESMEHRKLTGNTYMPPAITTETVRMAVTTVTVAPILLVYPFLQKYFIKGIMIGAIKG